MMGLTTAGRSYIFVGVVVALGFIAAKQFPRRPQIEGDADVTLNAPWKGEGAVKAAPFNASLFLIVAGCDREASNE